MARRRAIGDSKKHWSDAQKLEAVQLWLTLGNMALVSATLKIPDQTLFNWKKTDWWNHAVEEIRVQDKIQLSARAKQVVDRSLETIVDRLDNGDWIYDQKSGELRRKPVSIKDAITAANVMMDKHASLTREETVEKSNERLEDKLDKLMNAFAQISGKAPVIVTDVIEGDFSAVHEEREEGLQDGVPEIPFEAGANQEPDGEDAGTSSSEQSGDHPQG